MDHIENESVQTILRLFWDGGSKTLYLLIVIQKLNAAELWNQKRVVQIETNKVIVSLALEVE